MVVAGYHGHNVLSSLELFTEQQRGGTAPAGIPRHRLWKVRARQVVLATGSIERPLVFANNDLPGIMLAGAAQSYIRRFPVRPGTPAGGFTNNDNAPSPAPALHDSSPTPPTPPPTPPP